MADQNITAKFETTVHFLKYELKFLFGKRVNFKMYPVCNLFLQIKQIWSTSLYQTYRLYVFTDISIKNVWNKSYVKLKQLRKCIGISNFTLFKVYITFKTSVGMTRSNYSKFISHLKRQLEWQDQISSDFLDGIHCLSFFFLVIFKHSFQWMTHYHPANRKYEVNITVYIYIIQWNLSNLTHQGTREMCQILQDVRILWFYFS
jgi:hypothetical protein